MKTRHSSVTRSLQNFIVLMKVEPDTDAERRLLIDAFDQESDSLQTLVEQHLTTYVKEAFPGMRLVKANHEKYPTLLRVYLEQSRRNQP